MNNWLPGERPICGRCLRTSPWVVASFSAVSLLLDRGRDKHHVRGRGALARQIQDIVVAAGLLVRLVLLLVARRSCRDRRSRHMTGGREDDTMRTLPIG